MDAPIYPPAVAYEAPAIPRYRLSLGVCSAGELMANPAAWAIVTKYLPAVKFMVGSPQVQSQLGSMSVLDFGTFSMPFDPALVATVDGELAALGLMEAAR